MNQIKKYRAGIEGDASLRRSEGFRVGRTGDGVGTSQSGDLNPSDTLPIPLNRRTE